MLLPAPDCPLCPRLVAFREANALQFPHFYNGAVPPFGDGSARLLVVGLAPGLKGANASGRPFTGDFAGDILYAALKRHGFAEGEYAKRADDGFLLSGARVSNAVRCVPPENKPTPAEAKTCNRFLQSEMVAMKDLRVVLALGSISHGAILRAAGYKAAHGKFAHAAEHALSIEGRAVTLLDSYHTSRYNIQTRRLTADMFDAIVARAAALVLE